MELWKKLTKDFNGAGLPKELKANEFTLQCYITLCKIKTILEDKNLNDKECFFKIEEIVNAFEEINVNISFRHDF